MKITNLIILILVFYTLKNFSQEIAQWSKKDIIKHKIKTIQEYELRQRQNRIDTFIQMDDKTFDRKGNLIYTLQRDIKKELFKKYDSLNNITSEKIVNTDSECTENYINSYDSNGNLIRLINLSKKDTLSYFYLNNKIIKAIYKIYNPLLVYSFYR